MAKLRQNGSNKSSRGRGEKEKPRGRGYKQRKGAPRKDAAAVASRGRDEKERPRGRGHQQRKGAPRKDVAAIAAVTGLPSESLAIVQCELGYSLVTWVDVQNDLAHYAAGKVNAPAEVQRALVEKRGSSRRLSPSP